MRQATIMRMSLRVFAGVVLAAGSMGGAAIAAPAPRLLAEPLLTAEDPNIVAGDVLVLHGHGFPRDAHITLRAGRDGHKTARIGSAETGRRGSFLAEVRIEASAARGTYVAIACHDRCRIKATVLFHVRRP